MWLNWIFPLHTLNTVRTTQRIQQQQNLEQPVTSASDYYSLTYKRYFNFCRHAIFLQMSYGP